jgi:hypothetical protein
MKEQDYLNATVIYGEIENIRLSMDSISNEMNDITKNIEKLNKTNQGKQTVYDKLDLLLMDKLAELESVENTGDGGKVVVDPGNGGAVKK